MRAKLALFQIRKTFMIVPYVFIFSLSDIFLASPGNEELSDTLWFGIFGHLTSGNIQTIVITIESIGLIFLFCLLFGDYISHFFCSTGVFIFSRMGNRSTWTLKRILELYGLSLLYTGILLVLKICISLRQVTNWSLDTQLFLSIFTLLFTLSSLLSSVCLIANLFSSYFGNSIGVFFACTVILIFEIISILFFNCPTNIILNPLCFNISVLQSPVSAMLKIFIDFFYMIAFSICLIHLVQNKDIF